MNRFRTRRKGKDDADVDGSSSVPYLSGRTFRRNKKAASPAPEVDLSTVLPSTENFRTSLLMPKLSARFSMLREQDDPASKIGKASDDSVIVRRASRLGDLLDLPEEASIRPPFARDRLGSYASADGYGTDDDSSMFNGSVMSRARPGEGNVLFGGRQKVYKISAGPSGSTKDLNAAGARFLYEPDVHSSAFRTLPERSSPAEGGEREERGGPVEAAGDGSREPPLDSTFHARTGSPSPHGYNRKRETSSSTGSAPSNERSSTAATSVASHAVGPGPAVAAPGSASPPTTTAPAPAPAPAPGKPQRAPTKSRRLYDQGLDQHMHEQQSSALSRLDQLARPRPAGAGSPPPDHIAPLSHASSVSSLRERYNRNAPAKPSAPGFRAMSPTPPTTGNETGSFPVGRNESSPFTTASRPSRPQSPPLSPVGSDEDATIASPVIQPPPDHRTAIASGAVPRPTRPYDERQYSQRQLQMQRERLTSPTRDGASRSIGVTSSTEPRPAGPTPPPTSATLTSALSESRPASSSVKEDVHGATRAPVNGAEVCEVVGGASSPTNAPGSGTFLAPRNARDSGSVVDSETEGERILGVQRNGRPRATSESRDERRAAEHGHLQELPAGTAPVTDTTLHPEDALLSLPGPGLSGLVRQHLRTDSGQSSVHAPSPRLPSPPVASGAAQANGAALAGDGPSPRPFAVNCDDGGGPRVRLPDMSLSSTDRRGPVDGGHLSPIPPLAVGGPPAKDLPREPFNGPSHGSPHDAESTPRHARNASTETQKEREEFANELAQRRKMVQENLKSFVDSENRSASPSREKSKTDVKRLSPLRAPSSAFNILKPKPSPASAAASKLDASTKAMKMLGITADEVHGESARDKKPGVDRGKNGEDKMPRNIGPAPNSPPPPARNWGQIRRDARRELERRQRENKEAGKQVAGSQTPSPPSSRGSARDRSGSDTSGGRPKVKLPLTRDDPRVATLEGPGQDPARRGPPPPHPRSSPHDPSQPFSYPMPSNDRHRDPSRPAPAPAPSHPRRIAIPDRLEIVSPLDLPPRPSPIAPYSANSTPSLTPSPVPSSRTSPTKEFAQPAGTLPAHFKKVVQKSDISEPTLLTSTSDITTIDLPPGACLSNGTKRTTPPPLPPINPRRKTRVPQGGLNGLGRGMDPGGPSPVPSSTPSPEERGAFSDHDSPPATTRLWKASGEPANANATSRPPYAMPGSSQMLSFPRDPQQQGPTTVAVAEGGMF